MPALLVIKDILLLTLKTLSVSIALITQTEHQMLKTYSLLDESLMNHLFLTLSYKTFLTLNAVRLWVAPPHWLRLKSHGYDMQQDWGPGHVSQRMHVWFWVEQFNNWSLWNLTQTFFFHSRWSSRAFSFKCNLHLELISTSNSLNEVSKHVKAWCTAVITAYTISQCLYEYFIRFKGHILEP